MNLEDRIKYAEIKAKHLDKLKPWYKKWWGILIVIFLFLFFSLLSYSAFYVYNKVQEIKSEQNQQRKEDAIHITQIINRPNTYYLGAEKPIVTIVEFSDFACPFCQQSNEIIKEIINKYPNKVRLVFRDYPLYEQSIALSLAARCAGAQNKFWPMHDKIFANQGPLLTLEDDELESKLITLASTLNIDKNKFTQCLQEKIYLKDIQLDYKDAELLDIEGTPTWFINNYKITGYLDKENFNKLISGLLQQYGTN